MISGFILLWEFLVFCGLPILIFGWVGLIGLCCLLVLVVLWVF